MKKDFSSEERDSKVMVSKYNGKLYNPPPPSLGVNLQECNCYGFPSGIKV